MHPVLPDLDWAPVRPFWAAAARGELHLPRCSACDRFQWYPRLLCPVCLCPDLTWTPVVPTGAVYSHTTVHRAFGSGMAVPYGVVQLRLDHAPGVVLITGVAEPGEVVIGARMRVAFAPAGEGVFLPVSRRTE